MAATRTITFPFAPLPVHMPFHASAAKIKVAIGGVGSGKSAALCMEAIRFALAQPGSYMLLTRRTVPDLRRSTEKELFEILPAELEKACRIKRLGGHVESITFPNHSQLLLAGMEDWNKHKALADDQPVLTPEGWRPMGSLRVGDSVIAGDGRPTRVRAVTPQGVRQMYRVSVADGGSVECDAEHLWTVYRQGGRRQECVVTTAQLKTGRNRDVLPLLPAVDYGPSDPLPIDPYVLGALLGDGGLTQRQIGFTCAPEDATEIVGELRARLGAAAVTKHAAPYQYGLRRTKARALYEALEQEGLTGCDSHAKFVPDRYLRAAPADRALVLQGLMDTDGSAGRTQNRFVSVSRRLAEGVQELARSLGCIAAVRARTNRYGPVYCVNITPPADLELFKLARKVARTFRYRRCGAGRAVASVEATRMAACTCIEVEHPRRLFVTKGYLVTHNSMNLSWIGIDESSEQTRDNFEGILTRLRQSKPLKGAPPLRPGQRMQNQMALASNPAGQDWNWDLFVNPATKRGDSSIHLSTPMDNPFLPPEYVDMLLQMPVPYIRRFVECRFDAAAGRVYEEWGWDTHIVPDREPGHYGEVMWMGMDPGILNPTAGLWVEVDRRHGRLVAVAEYQEPGRNAPEHAAAWRALEAKRRPIRVTRRIADPNITKRDQGTSMELSDIYQRLGFSFEKGPVRDDVRIPALANAIASGGLVATESCARLHEQLTEARWEDQLARLRDLGDFREKMKKGNDHLHDCAQYLASIYVQPSARNLPAAPPPPTEQDDIEALWHRERARKLAAQARGHEYDGWAPRDGVLL